jgi:cell division protein FtsB
MRRSRVAATAGKVNRRTPPTRELAVLVALAGLGVWIAYAFAQEALLSQGLSRQAGQMEARNAALAARNASYEKDIAVMSSGAGAEEAARLNGYARSDEKVYLVSRPQPSAQPTRKPVVKVESSPNPLDSFRRWLGDLWHR